jgi:hypothetical protein
MLRLDQGRVFEEGGRADRLKDPLSSRVISPEPAVSYGNVMRPGPTSPGSHRGSHWRTQRSCFETVTELARMSDDIGPW